jgi:hypothetical protein
MERHHHYWSVTSSDQLVAKNICTLKNHVVMSTVSAALLLSVNPDFLDALYTILYKSHYCVVSYHCWCLYYLYTLCLRFSFVFPHKFWLIRLDVVFVASRQQFLYLCVEMYFFYPKMHLCLRKLFNPISVWFLSGFWILSLILVSWWLYKSIP